MGWLFKRKKATVAATESSAPDPGLTQELYRKNVELAHTNRTLSLLRIIDGLVLEPDNTVIDLSKGISDALIENSNYPFSAIFIGDVSKQQPLMLKGISFSPQVSWSAIESENFKSLKLLVNRPWFQSRELSELIDISAMDNGVFGHIFEGSPTRVLELMRRVHISTVYLVKLMARRRLVGVMAVGITDARPNIKLEELEHLGRAGEAAGIALDNKLLFEEYQQVLQRLQQSNEKLQALDEAKDEFISMASHQLRTPLTSVKGFLSMLSEGDAGELNADQRKFIDQAFNSAQRMVYLIADLLNVSRLKTGKFVIEPTEVYLPDMINEELAQLQETAKARNIEIIYNKPPTFPKLMLDDNKIRQVIMNFADNAIYYSKTGGHVKVELVQNGDSNVQFTVTDDGIGVPKSDQQHLFSKFYRAPNAKKARPDGTGLGLFMAKKVVVASGGALLFKSEEGKGSTFGFSFPLKPVPQENPNFQTPDKA